MRGLVNDKSQQIFAGVRDRAVRMVVGDPDDYSSEWAAITSVSSKLGMTPETLRVWVRRAQIDGGLRPGLTTD